MLTDYTRALHAELLKLKRTPALVLTTISPYMVVALFAVSAFSRGHRFLNPPHTNAWEWMLSSSLTLWIAVLVPLTIALVAALLAELETRGGQWKHLCALPVERGAYYLAKQIVAGLLLTCGTALLVSGVWFSGLALRVLKPGLGFDQPFPWSQAFTYLVAVSTAAASLVALHAWLSLRWASFVPGIAIGFLGLSMAGILAAQDLWLWFPWRMSTSLVPGLETLSVEWMWPLVSLLSAVLFTLLGAWDITRRDIY